MAASDVQARVQAPGIVDRDEVFQVRTLIAHPMETGLRRDESGHIIPRRLIHAFSCAYDGRIVFSAEFHEAVAADPFLSFYVRAGRSGSLRFTWVEDGGVVTTLESSLTVRA